MRMRPWNSAPRWRYSHRKLAQTVIQIRQTRIIKWISRKMGSQGLSLVLVRRKIRKCTQLYYKIKYSASIIPFCFMKFTIATRFARKIISILSKCSDRMTITLRSYTRQPRKCRRNVLSSTRAALIPPLSILNIQSWSSIVRALILLDPSTSPAVAIVQCYPQIRHLRNGDYSRMPLITRRSPLSTRSRIKSRVSGWTITSRRVCRRRDFVVCQIFCKVRAAHHK